MIFPKVGGTPIMQNLPIGGYFDDLIEEDSILSSSSNSKKNNYMIVKELKLKVTSICNLNCKYCYVFNQGDYSYKKEDAVMSEKIMEYIIKQLKQYCERHSLDTFLIIFHGGEPLLAPKIFYEKFIECAKIEIPETDIRFALQTNATLLSEEWIALFNSLDISVGLSLDGTREASKYRVFRSSGKNAYDKIIDGINLFYKNKYPIHTLSVINTQESPEVTYNHLKKNHITYSDFLYPDKIFDNKDSNDKLISSWLIELFELWYEDTSDDKPMIRLFDVLIGLILGVERGNETIGRKNNQTICIKPNGDIQAVDNLMVCGDGFTKTGYNVINNTFDEALKNQLMQKCCNSHKDSELCYKCKKCIIKNICGGGHLAHRYSQINGFDNPSVYCSEIFMLVMHIQNRIIDDLSELIDKEKFVVDKLTLEDFK